MQHLNRSFTIVLGVVGTLIMAAWAGVRYAVGGGSANSATAVASGAGRRFDSGRVGLRVPSTPHTLVSATGSRVGVVRPVGSPGARFMSAASLEPFGFPTPLGTLSVLRPAAIDW
jgi:hypothetical protein